MKYALIILGAWAVIGGLAAILNAAGDTKVNVFAYVGPAVVVAAALGAYALKRRREIREHTTDADSIELALSVRARAAAMVDGLILTLAAGLVLLIDGGALAPLVVCIAVLLTIADFSIRYGVLTSRSRSGR